MTIPLHLSDAYIKEMEATIVDVIKESDKRWQIVLDKTIFYPRGGGQSTDQGILFTEAWRGKVSQALQKEDKIVHYVEGEQPPLMFFSLNSEGWEQKKPGFLAISFSAFTMLAASLSSAFRIIAFIDDL
jgi:alanyl-tRNA synthetase